MAKILTIDIETKPTKAWVWRGYKENIAPVQVIEGGELLCFSAKWLGKKEIEFYSQWNDGMKGMLEAAHRLLSEADIVVTYNGERFDVPHFVTEFLVAGMSDIPPVASVDLYKVVRNKMKFFSNKLEHVADVLDVGHKMSHEGFGLWKKVIDGDATAQKKMRLYCMHDVRLTEGVYLKLRPFISGHPNIGNGHNCPKCGSAHMQSRGWRLTAMFRTQRLQCQKCKGWSPGKREKI